MPKQMFFNIKEDKRKRFLDAAMSEFTSKSFEQVSVNTIIKKAGISRGSFYTYFEDLESLFNYLFISVKEERFKYAKTIFVESNGDYFEFVRKLFIHDFDAFNSEHKYSLFRNYIHYIQTVKKGSIKDYIIMEVFKELEKNNVPIDVYLSQNKYGLNKLEMIDLFEMIVLIMINTLIKAENDEMSKEDVFALFFRRLDYIENGVRKVDSL